MISAKLDLPFYSEMYRPDQCTTHTLEGETQHLELDFQKVGVCLQSEKNLIIRHNTMIRNHEKKRQNSLASSISLGLVSSIFWKVISPAFTSALDNMAPTIFVRAVQVYATIKITYFFIKIIYNCELNIKLTNSSQLPWHIFGIFPKLRFTAFRQ